MLPAYRNVIINKLKTTAGMEDIEEIEHTYADIHTRYHVLNGAIYGLASHGDLWVRSSRESRLRAERIVSRRRMAHPSRHRW